MHVHRLAFALLCLTGLLASSAPVRAGGTVELNLVGDAQGSALDFQQWAQALGKAGIRNVRLRSGAGTEQPGIDTQGTADSPVYIVTGVISSRNEILLPGARFGRGDVNRLAAWLKDLAENGPVTGRAARSPNGLSPADFDKVHKDLTPSVGFATLGMTRRQAVEKIVAQLKFPLSLDADVVRALGDDKLEDELTNISRGTALACLLRPLGYCLAPRPEKGQPAYVVAKTDALPTDLKIESINLAKLTAWPAGWTSGKSSSETVPALFEFHNVNVQNVSAAAAIEAIGKRVKVPVLYDRKALAQHKIDPAKAMVSLKNTRTFYGSALRRLLFQARLKYEVRYDDSGSPFLWVTTSKPSA
jgi:hypothetical protein